VYAYKVCGNLGTVSPTATDTCTTPAICLRDNNGNQNDCGSASAVAWARNPFDSDGFVLSFDDGSDSHRSQIVFTWYAASCVD
jgi:hypothetical protein